MRLLFLLLLCLTSCAENGFETSASSVNPSSDMSLSTFEDMTTEKSKWICYHPNTSFHNEECVKEEYPVGCYVKGSLHRFCWLLHKDDCGSTLNEGVLEPCRNVGYLK